MSLDSTPKTQRKKQNSVLAWLIRFIKGIVIGTGAILPGVSGGVLAAIFNVYERMIAFLADIRRDFVKNALYFLPLALGGIVGVFIFSYVVDYLFKQGQAQLIWFFIGCIAGTLPLLFHQAGKKGRRKKHFAILIISTAITFVFLSFGESLFTGVGMPHNFATWMMSGAFMGLGAIVPGLSPSNFLIYMNLYQPMVEGISRVDFGVIIPVGLGFAVIVVVLSKGISYLFHRAYAGVYHIILGVILASTLKIIPLINYISLDGLTSLLAAAVGVLLGLWMSRLEVKYKS